MRTIALGLGTAAAALTMMITTGTASADPADDAKDAVVLKIRNDDSATGIWKVYEGFRGCIDLNPDDIPEVETADTRTAVVVYNKTRNRPVRIWRSPQCRGQDGGLVQPGRENYRFATKGWSVQVG